MSFIDANEGVISFWLSELEQIGLQHCSFGCGGALLALTFSY